VNIALGKNADKIASPNDFMFLPYYLMSILKDSQIANNENIIVNVPVTPHRRFNFSFISGWIIALIIIFLSFLNKSRRIILYVYLSVIGFIGLILLTISFVSENTAFSNNLNIVWTAPSFLVLLFYTRQINEVFKLIYISLLVLLILSWNIIPQDFSTTFIPWILTLIVVLLLDLKWFAPILMNSRNLFRTMLVKLVK
jgi:hypothetical protein